MKEKLPIKNVEEARAALVSVLSNSTNSSDVESIVKAVDNYINAKIKKAMDNHMTFYHDVDDSPDGGNF